MYNVMIVEDDPMVAAIDRRYVEMDGRFRVMKVCGSAERALSYEDMDHIDLIILDYFMPAMNGAEFIDRLHEAGHAPSIIMVTSANDKETVMSLISRGVTDYLVKPFEYDRFHKALSRFAKAKALFESRPGAVGQKDLDQLLNGFETREAEQTILAKGLNAATLDRIRAFLRAHTDASYTSEQISQEVGLSRITVRRYVNYMVDTGELTSSIDYRTGGRPGIHYRYKR